MPTRARSFRNIVVINLFGPPAGEAQREAKPSVDSVMGDRAGVEISLDVGDVAACFGFLGSFLPLLSFGEVQ